jgi:hypothetical protein
MSGIGQSITAAMPKLVGMDFEWHRGSTINPAKQRMEGFGSHWPTTFGNEDIGFPTGCSLLAL